MADKRAGDLFFIDLINRHVPEKRFVHRDWLVQDLEDALNQEQCRFVLLKAVPGVGKTAIMAWLAREHPEWLRYFTRHDSKTPSAAAAPAPSCLPSDTSWLPSIRPCSALRLWR